MRSLAALLALLTTAPAHAELVTFWAAGKGELVGGTGDTFDAFGTNFGGGAALGIEVVGIDIWGDALVMGADQYLFTANAGVDFDFGDDGVRLTTGLFTGPMFFIFPEPTVEPTFDRALLERTGLSAARINQIEKAYLDTVDDQKKASRFAAGWNLLRLKLGVEVQLAPVLFLGLDGSVGYHYLITGEEAAADEGSKFIDKLAEKYPDVREYEDQIREATGAEEVDPDGLGGVNYSGGIYLKLEI